MEVITPQDDLQARVERVEAELAATAAALSRNEARLRALEVPRSSVAPPRSAITLPRERDARPVAVPPLRVSPAPPPAPRRPPTARRDVAADEAALSDFLGGRALAWLGGLTTVLGIVLGLALAISRGLIGLELRVDLAGAASLTLLAAGLWLHARRGRTEAAVAMAGAAVAGGFATLIVAERYAILPDLAALAGALVLGAVATVLAVRWAGRALAALGLLGGLSAPILLGGPITAWTLAMVGAGAACAVSVVLWRRWVWLAIAAVAICAPQWVAWTAQGHAPLADGVVLAAFAALGLAAAVFVQLRAAPESRAASGATLLLIVNAGFAGAVGRLALGEPGGEPWLAGLALAYAAVALWRRPRVRLQPGFRRLALSCAVLSADVALASVLHGAAQAAGFAAAATGFAWLLRRTPREQDGGVWLEAGLGTHIGLVLLRAVIEAPPSSLSDAPSLPALMSVLLLAAACVTCAQVAGTGRGPWRLGLHGLGLLAVGYLTAATLDGAALVAAWTVQAIALAAIGHRAGDSLARYGAFAFLAAADLHATTVEAPPAALVHGAASLPAAATALLAIAIGALAVGRAASASPSQRRLLLAGSALAVVYLVSVAVITVYQPASGAAGDTLLDLGVRQQGQVLLSALWGAIGIYGLTIGLRRNIVRLRTAALAFLLLTVAKVFLYDLQTLTSIYRVGSFLILGALLLSGAFIYQRLRPPPPPDLRTVHPTQR